MAKKTNLTKPNIDALLERTNTASPTKEDMALVRQYLDENPKTSEQNEPTQVVIERLVAAYCPDSKLLQEVTLRHFEKRRQEMGYSNSPWIVRSLIDQVIVCEFRLTRFELTHYNNVDGTSHTLTSGIYYEKRLGMIQRRFQRAVEALAKIRLVMAEVELLEQKAEAKKSQARLAKQQSTLASQRLYKALSD